MRKSFTRLKENGVLKGFERSAKEFVENLIVFVGDNPSRDGIRKTPERFFKAITEILSGYSKDPLDEVGDAIYPYESSEKEGIVYIKKIDFYSVCEHHILPFFGTCSVAYIPDGKIIGLSKVPRVVEVFSRRLQVQENLTRQIGEFLWSVLEPKGIAVRMNALHLCLAMRGVKKSQATLETFFFKGLFEKNENLKREFIINTSGGG